MCCGVICVWEFELDLDLEVEVSVILMWRVLRRWHETLGGFGVGVRWVRAWEMVV